MSKPNDNTLTVRGPPPPLPPRAPGNQHQPHPPRPPPSDAPPPVAPPQHDSIFASAEQAGNDYGSLAQNDPRSRSTDSLVPTRSNEEDTNRRRLLLIFIHGFMGDETSFQSFPAHVHHLLSALVVESHTVHTKVYPRYRSKKNIRFARDDFSRWLSPHEASTTDVVLCGHSMGGLLSAEVALLARPSESRRSHLQHRILGTINFDVPFLGMHPGVIKSGLASIFSPAPDTPKPKTEAGPSHLMSSNADAAATGDYMTLGRVPPQLPPRRVDTLYEPQQLDPNYNPAFENDVVLPVRKGWEKVWHFVNKHSDNITAATKQLVTSHLEFGGVMADYSGLKLRYARIRALEESNESVRSSVLGGIESPPRVRFINYYTASTGRPKKPKPPKLEPASTEDDAIAGQVAPDQEPLPDLGSEIVRSNDASTGPEHGTTLTMPDGTQSVPGDVDRENIDEDEHEDESDGESMEPTDVMEHLDPRPVSEYGDTSEGESWADAVEDLHADDDAATEPKSDPTTATFSTNDSDPPLAPTPNASASQSLMSLTSLTTTQSLPPLPELPPKPSEPDYALYTDKDMRKLAERDYARSLKTYNSAVKDLEKAQRDRAKLEEKRERRLLAESKKSDAQRAREQEKEAKRIEKEKEKEAKRLEKDKEKKRAEKTRSHDEILKLERRETEREWNEALNSSWNEEDSTIGPGESASRDASASTSASRLPPEHLSTSASASTFTLAHHVSTSATQSHKQPEKPPKDRMFCTLPPKDSSGQRDPCWVRVFMKDVDEVGAHCGLFFVSETYERLVGDVAERVEQWVAESESERVAALYGGEPLD
ncbi:hypothetical protein MBLNU459_g1679t1 [Dothideomycetes sp. NU459]